VHHHSANESQQHNLNTIYLELILDALYSVDENNDCAHDLDEEEKQDSSKNVVSEL
jgi:hypothetical protein